MVQKEDELYGKVFLKMLLSMYVLIKDLLFVIFFLDQPNNR